MIAGVGKEPVPISSVKVTPETSASPKLTTPDRGIGILPFRRMPFQLLSQV
jgi:hypothetical protein